MKAHDVRHLAVCPECHTIGDDRIMVHIGNDRYHDHCAYRVFGECIRDLPPVERGKFGIVRFWTKQPDSPRVFNGLGENCENKKRWRQHDAQADQGCREGAGMNDPRMVTARWAAKLISPGTVKGVRFRFDAIGPEKVDHIGWLRVPKVEAKRMLRQLDSEAFVRFYDPEEDGIAYISGAFPARDCT